MALPCLLVDAVASGQQHHRPAAAAIIPCTDVEQPEHEQQQQQQPRDHIRQHAEAQAPAAPSAAAHGAWMDAPLLLHVLSYAAGEAAEHWRGQTADCLLCPMAEGEAIPMITEDAAAMRCVCACVCRVRVPSPLTLYVSRQGWA